jgi:hypothetical protein
MRAVDPTLPVIAVSGSETAWAAAQRFGPTGWGTGESAATPLAQARRVGADITLGKPFEVGALLSAVERLLARRRTSAAPGGTPAALAAEPAESGPTAHPGGPPPQLYYVLQDRYGQWRVRKHGSAQPAARSDSKADAIFLARKLASAALRGRVVVQNADGTIDAEFRYGDADETGAGR